MNRRPSALHILIVTGGLAMTGAVFIAGGPATGRPSISLHFGGASGNDARGSVTCHLKDPVITGGVGAVPKSSGFGGDTVGFEFDPSASHMSLFLSGYKTFQKLDGTMRAEVVGEGLSRAGSLHADFPTGSGTMHVDGTFDCAGVGALQTYSGGGGSLRADVQLLQFTVTDDGRTLTKIEATVVCQTRVLYYFLQDTRSIHLDEDGSFSITSHLTGPPGARAATISIEGRFAQLADGTFSVHSPGCDPGTQLWQASLH